MMLMQKQRMPYPSNTRLFPHFSWLLHPSTTNYQKAQPKYTMSYLLVAEPHKGLFDSKSLSNNDFRLVVDSKSILHSEGEHTTKPNGLVIRNDLVYFDNHIGLVGPIKLVKPISPVGHTNNFVGPFQLIVESKYFNDSKISLHFRKDCGIFCEGDQENVNNGNDMEDNDIIVWQKSNLLSLLSSLIDISHINPSGIGRISSIGHIGCNSFIQPNQLH
jgi:hypothetical protein